MLCCFDGSLDVLSSARIMRSSFVGLDDDDGADLIWPVMGSMTRRVGAPWGVDTFDRGFFACFSVADLVGGPLFGATGAGRRLGALDACFACLCSLRASLRALTLKRRAFLAGRPFCAASSMPSSSRSAAGSRVVERALSTPRTIQEEREKMCWVEDYLRLFLVVGRSLGRSL